MIKMDNKNVTWLTFKPGKQPPYEKKTLTSWKSLVPNCRAHVLLTSILAPARSHTFIILS